METVNDAPKSTSSARRGVRGKAKQAVDFLVWFVKDQWFLFGLALALVVSSQVQVPASQRELKQTVTTYVTVAVICFITGCTLDTRALIDNYMQWKQILFVQVNCFLVTSSVAFAVVSAAATDRTFMDPWLLIGLLLNSCVSTTISTNVVMTTQAHGNTALTVVQTTVGNLISPFVTPALLKMYLSCGAWYTQVLPPSSTQWVSLYKHTLMQLGLSTYVPLFVGQLFRNLFPKTNQTVFVKYKVKKLSSVALLVLVWQTLDNAFGADAFRSVAPSNVVFVVFVSLAFWLAWQAVAVAAALPWMARADVVSTAYCAPTKTASLGVPLSFTFFAGLSALDEAKIQLPVAVFQLLQVALGSLATIPLRRWAVRGKAAEDDDDDEESLEVAAKRERA